MKTLLLIGCLVASILYTRWAVLTGRREAVSGVGILASVWFFCAVSDRLFP